MERFLAIAAPQSPKLGGAWTPNGQLKDQQENPESCVKLEAHQEDPAGDGAQERGDFSGVLGTRPTPPVTQATRGPQRRGAPGKSPKRKDADAGGPQKPWTCEDCGKAFRYGSAFTLHRRTHTGEKPFACLECGRAFSQRVHLTLHRRVHTGERPHACTECGKAFRQGSYLAAHWHTHTGERPHVCPDCGKAFVRPAHLVQHQRMHTGERPFACGQCAKAFRGRAALLEHQRAPVCLRAVRQGLRLLLRAAAPPAHAHG